MAAFLTADRRARGLKPCSNSWESAVLKYNLSFRVNHSMTASHTNPVEQLRFYATEWQCASAQSENCHASMMEYIRVIFYDGDIPLYI